MSSSETSPDRRRGRPRRGAAALSLPTIQAAALALVDREGLKSLTMRHLGVELGVDAMAVYHYLPGKSALHDALIEAVMAGFQLPSGFEALSLGEGVRAAAVAYRDAVLAHPNTLTVLATRPFLTPGALRTVEIILGFLASHGLDPIRATAVINASSAYVLGSLFSWISHVQGGEDHQHGGIPWESLDPAEVPNLLALAQATGGEFAYEATFEAGLLWLIQGLSIDEA